MTPVSDAVPATSSSCSAWRDRATDTGGELYGRERLQRALAGARPRPGTRIDELLASINVFAGCAPQADDITVLILDTSARVRRAVSIA